MTSDGVDPVARPKNLFIGTVVAMNAAATLLEAGEASVCDSEALARSSGIAELRVPR